MWQLFLCGWGMLKSEGRSIPSLLSDLLEQFYGNVISVSFENHIQEYIGIN